MSLTVDDVLEQIGGYEKYQILLLFMFGYVAITLDSFPTMIVTFITAEPDWVCVQGNNSMCNFTQAITLTSDDYMARCDMPREDWTYVADFTSTVTEFDLVCENSYLQSVAQSCYWAGVMVGLIIGGYLADRFGRKIVFYTGVVGIVIATWVMVFPKYFAVFIAGRLFNGLGSGFMNATYYVIVAEYTSKRHRAKLCISLFYFWIIALLLLALLAYLIRDWRYLLLCSAILGTPGLALWWFTPESVRWLLLQGQEDKARQELNKVAKINKKTMPKDDLVMPESTETHGNLLHLFQNKKLAKSTLINWDIWITVALVYYGVSYGSVDLGWDRYLTFALTSLVEIPAVYLAVFSAERFGRKKSTIVGLLVSCVASIVAISIPEDRSNTGFIAGRIAMAALAKLFINISFACIYLWIVEIFPTFLRSMALSTASASGRLGSFTASYVIWLIRIHPLLPFGIMGLMCLKSACLAFLLPETQGQDTLETIGDVNSVQTTRNTENDVHNEVDNPQKSDTKF
ncbi:organic cation transporter -like [Paramuricea clavata]|uniref:Organic cation transporter -like n=1 Tax=Paramuricea clavata TaxID=317549 RepID=A0A7D9HFQ6_PARCT|nr:organic cation transporter -like [Paramuricea clavata]